MSNPKNPPPVIIPIVVPVPVPVGPRDPFVPPSLPIRDPRFPTPPIYA